MTIAIKVANVFFNFFDNLFFQLLSIYQVLKFLNPWRTGVEILFTHYILVMSPFAQSRPCEVSTHLYNCKGGIATCWGLWRLWRLWRLWSSGYGIVDILKPLTVNSSAVMLVITLADKVNGAQSRRWASDGVVTQKSKTGACKWYSLVGTHL